MNPETIMVSESTITYMSEVYELDFAIIEWKNGVPRKLDTNKKKKHILEDSDFGLHQLINQHFLILFSHTF